MSTWDAERLEASVVLQENPQVIWVGECLHAVLQYRGYGRQPGGGLFSRESVLPFQNEVAAT